MRISRLEIPDVLLITPQVHKDDRGYFVELWHAEKFCVAGLDAQFVQDNQSGSQRGTLRGLHYQIRHPQGKLVRTVSGEIFDVAVDLRRRSPTFGRWVATTLTADDRQQLYVPPGFAHGFLVTSERAEVVYKCTDHYFPEHECTLLWNDPDVGIAWPLPSGATPRLSVKDQAGRRLAEAEVYP